MHLLRQEHGYDPSCGSFSVSVYAKESAFGSSSTIDIQYERHIDKLYSFARILRDDKRRVSVTDIKKLLDDAHVPAHIQDVSTVNMIMKCVDETRYPAHVSANIYSHLETFEGYKELVDEFEISSMEDDGDYGYAESVDEFELFEDDEDFEDVETVAKPARREVVDSLERKKIRVSERKKVCVVCMENFRVERKAIRMPCSHVFHEGCIVKWLENRNVCPLCRFELQHD